MWHCGGLLLAWMQAPANAVCMWSVPGSLRPFALSVSGEASQADLRFLCFLMAICWATFLIQSLFKQFCTLWHLPKRRVDATSFRRHSDATSDGRLAERSGRLAAQPGV